jgi:gliding motility-associated-like protein
MKKILLFILLLTPFLGRAGHVGGIDLFYTHLTGNTYRVTMIVYGNCGDSEFPKLYDLNPQIDVIDSIARTKFTTMELKLHADSVSNASPYCPRYADSTNCKYANSIYQGYFRFIYTDTLTLPRTSTRWVFRFNSAMKSGCGNRLGRPSLNNYANVSSNNAILEATLNNTTGNNSSPNSKVTMFPSYCVNVPSVYDQMTSDPNNDSMVYEIIRPMYSINCININLLVPVTNYNPLHTAPGNYSFDPTNGRLSFTADLIQTSAVNVKISEYRNGTLVGTVMRERIFKVLGNCNNLPPVTQIDTSSTALSGATLIAPDTLFTCAGNTVKFKFPVSNPSGDTVRATFEEVISGSNIIVANNNTAAPEINFEWNTVGVANGAYTFYTRFVTRSCPLPNTSLVKYTVIVGDAGSITASTLSATNCVGKAAVKFELQGGRRPYSFTVQQNGNTIKTYTGDTTGVIEDSLAAGSYKVSLVSEGLPCVTDLAFEVVDSGSYPYMPTVVSPVTFCRNADSKLLIATPPDSISTLQWFDPSGSEITGAPTPPTNISGTTYWYVNSNYKGCASLKDSIQVIIEQAECDYDLTVYNVITPNGDGKNDVWMLKNIHYYPDIMVQVFNKLGDKVYERRGYQNDWNGDNLPSGTYYYLIKLNGINRTTGKDTYTGYLVIKR